MLAIREEQFSAFNQTRLKQFEDRMFAYLNSNFSEYTREMSEKVLRMLIQDGINTSAGYHITLDYDIQRYLEFMVMYGHDFDRLHEITLLGKVLRDNTLDGTAKMDLIDEYELDMVRGQYE